MEKEKPISGVNFKINFQAGNQVSQTKTQKEELDKLCKEANKLTKRVFNPSKLLKKKFFEILNVKDEQDLLKKYESIRKSNNETNETFWMEIQSKLMETSLIATSNKSKLGRILVDKIIDDLKKIIEEKRECQNI